MTKIPAKLWIKDIIRAIEKIERHPLYSQGRTAFQQDEYFRDVVELNIERVCEAAKHLCDEYSFDDRYPDVPWRDIIGTRIVIAHHYWQIEESILWGIVDVHLPNLKAQALTWLDNED